jgi:hypothetical protein
VGKELAAGLNANSQLVTTLLANLNGFTGEQVALGLNDNAAGGKAFLETMLGATSPEFAQVLANAINTAPYNMDNFISVLIQNLDASTAQAVAAGLNGNTDFLRELLMHLDGQGTAEQLASNEVWTINLVRELTKDENAGALAEFLNTALKDPGVHNFMEELLSALDGGNIATILNNNPGLMQDLMVRAGQIGLGSQLKNLLAEAGAGGPEGFLTELLQELDVDMVVNAMGLNDPDTNTRTGSFTYGDDPRLPKYEPGQTRRTFLDVTWFYVDSFTWGLLPAPMWANIVGCERAHWDP